MTADPIVQYLQHYGPTLSSKIKDYLLSRGVKDDAARQRLSRAAVQGVRRLNKLFPDKAGFLYLDKQYKQPNYWLNLLRDLTDKNTTYGRALNALNAKGGCIKQSQFYTISSAPNIKTDGHLSSDVVLETLIRIGFLEIKNIENELYVQFAENTPFTVPESFVLRNRQIIEDMLLAHVKEWLKRSSFVSFEAVTSRLQPHHKGYGPFAWDIVGPSYLRPLVKYDAKNNKLTNGFVAADVFLGVELKASEVAYFVYKAQTCSKIGIPPALLFLVADWFEKEAFDLGKKHGLSFVTPEILFGKDVAESLKELVQVLTHAAAVAAKEPDKISRILHTLSQTDVDFNNLKGALFNLIVGHMVLQGEGGSIDIGKKIRYHSEAVPIEREMDVRLCVGNHTVTVYECKGYKSPITLTEAETWVKSKIPNIYKALRQEERFVNAKISFEIWSTGGFEPDALEYLKTVATKLNKYQVVWKDNKAIIAYSMEKNLPQMRAMIKEFY